MDGGRIDRKKGERKGGEERRKEREERFQLVRFHSFRFFLNGRKWNNVLSILASLMLLSTMFKPCYITEAKEK